MDSTVKDHTLGEGFKRRERYVYAFLVAVLGLTAADLVHKYRQEKAAEAHSAMTAPAPTPAP